MIGDNCPVNGGKVGAKKEGLFLFLTEVETTKTLSEGGIPALRAGMEDTRWEPFPIIPHPRNGTRSSTTFLAGQLHLLQHAIIYDDGLE